MPRDQLPTTKAQAIAQLRKTLPKAIADRAIVEIEEGGESAIQKWFLATLKTAPQRTRTERALAKEIHEEERADAREAGVIAYMSRAVVVATLPHAKPPALEFKRRSGDYTLLMHIPQELARETGVQLPYGPIPRLIFLWITTEVKRTRERVLHLGDTRSAFMRKLMLEPRTGKRGNMRMFETQLKSLLATTFSAWRSYGDREGGGGLRLHHRSLACDTDLWWEAGADGRFEATLQIDSEFHREMLQGGIPVDLGTVQRFKENSLALDIYVWLTYRFSSLRAPRIVPWAYLTDQFGSEYQGPNGQRAFREYFRKQLKRVLEAYPEAHVTSTRKGLHLYPSATHVKLRRQ